MTQAERDRETMPPASAVGEVSATRYAQLVKDHGEWRATMLLLEAIQASGGSHFGDLALDGSSIGC
jgi:hypothetical protein